MTYIQIIPLVISGMGLLVIIYRELKVGSLFRMRVNFVFASFHNEVQPIRLKLPLWSLVKGVNIHSPSDIHILRLNSYIENKSQNTLKNVDVQIRIPIENSIFSLPNHEVYTKEINKDIPRGWEKQYRRLFNGYIEVNYHFDQITPKFRVHFSEPFLLLPNHLNELTKNSLRFQLFGQMHAENYHRPISHNLDLLVVESKNFDELLIKSRKVLLENLDRYTLNPFRDLVEGKRYWIDPLEQFVYKSRFRKYSYMVNQIKLGISTTKSMGGNDINIELDESEAGHGNMSLATFGD